MKKIVAIALMLAAAVAGATGYEDWFTPQKGWNGCSVPVHIQFGSSGGKDFNFPVTANLGDILDVLEAGAEDVQQTAKNAYLISISALANSIFAACQAQMNKVKIDNLGAALEGVFVSTYGQYVDEQGNVLSKSRSGVDTAKLRQQLIANKNAVVSGGQAAGGSEQNPLTIVVTQKPYDERQFEQHIQSGRSLTSLHGWYSLSDSDTAGLDGSDGWAFANTHYFIPFSNGKSSTLGWMKWNGWDTGCLSAGDDVTGGSNDKPLRLYGWTTADNCNESIQNLLTNETATVDRSRHKILTRYDSGSGATIHWMPFDESVIGGGSEGHADDKTIELTYDEGASSDDPKKFRLKGFDTANSAAASDPKDAKIPMADGSENLAWKKPSSLFNDTVFGTDSNGKVIIKATVEETGKTEVMTITQTGSGDSVTAQTIEGKPLASLTDDASLSGVVMVSGDKRIGIKNWNTVDQATAGFTLADKLENGTGYVNDPTRSPAVVIRNGGTLQYAAIGTMKPLQCDEQSITTNYTLGASVANKASIRGYREAEVGTVPKRTASGLEWVAMSEVDDASVVTNENGQIALKGFDTAIPEQATDGAVLPFVDATSDDLQWGSIMDFFADSVFRQSSETGKILLNGTSEEGKVKVLAMTGSGGDDQTISALTFDNASIDGNPAVGGIVQLHGFDVAPSPYASGDVSFADVLTNTTTQITGMSVPVRVPSANGATVAYVPMGKITGIPAAAVDNKTIEVNESDPQNKFLQLHGAAGEGITLEEGDVYQIGSDGKGKFAKLGAESDDAEVDAENASIESYTGEDGGKYFRLRDWMVNREGIPHILGWSEHALKYWTVDSSNGIDINSESGGEEIMLSGYLDADDGAIPYAKKDGNGLGWLNGVDNRIPLLHTEAAPTTMAIGASLDKANVSAVPTLNVSGFASGGNCSVSLNKMLSDPAETSNRSAHQFMARYSNGGDPSVHWVSIDGVIAGGGAPVDDASITTNTTHGAVTSGNASIYGFADAPAGTTPIVANVDGHKVLRWGLTGNFGLTATKSGAGWTYTVSAGYYTKARSAIWVSSDLTVSSSGWVYLKVPIGTGSSAVLEYNASSVPSSSSTYTYIPLYYCNTSVGVTDYRCQPHIQVWE